MSKFAFAQTFYLDKASVAQSSKAAISTIGLYCRNKPNPSNNSSGITYPGVSIMITETLYGVPVFSRNIIYTFARAEYNSIVPSSDATVETKFVFEKPVYLDTNKEYCFIVIYDNNAGYKFWTSKTGDYLVGSTNISPGASGFSTGRYYEYFGTFDDAESSQWETPSITATDWRYVSDTDAKFTIYIARYYHNGVSVDANASIGVTDTSRDFSGYNANAITISGNTIIVPVENMEILTFDQSKSIKEAFVGGQWVYQNTVFWPGGAYGTNTAATVSVTQACTTITASGAFPNGATFNWNTVFGGYTDDIYVVFHDTNKVNMRLVTDIVSNTVLTVNEPMTFSNTATKFMISPVAQLAGFTKSIHEGVNEAFLYLKKSKANSSVRFVNNCIEGITISGTGTGYSNSDILYVIGYEDVSGEVTGGYNAVANVRTDASGNLTAIYLSNSGCGFTNADAAVIVIANSSSGNTTANTSAGSGADLTLDIGATIKTELRSNNAFRGAVVHNIPIAELYPYMELDVPDGTSLTTKFVMNYVREASVNTLSGFMYYISQNEYDNIRIFNMNNTYTNNVSPVFISKSNEFVTPYSNGATNDIVTPTKQKSMELHFTRTSNSDYLSVCIESKPKIKAGRYSINNDYTNENTDRGNAWAKGISKRVSFGRLSEDIRVYLTAYRPPNTDVLVFAKIHNNADPEAFDDKEWTMLEEINLGQKVYSSVDDTNNYIEVEYGFHQHPNTSGPIVGSIMSSGVGTANLVGVGTSFDTDLTAGDLVRIYPTLFPNTNIHAVVNTVSNSTVVILDQQISNTSFIDVPLSVEVVDYKYQAFNNIMNDNVVRYYNSSMVEFDSYDTVQFKYVFLSDNDAKVPRIDDARVIGVSA